MANDEDKKWFSGTFKDSIRPTGPDVRMRSQRAVGGKPPSDAPVFVGGGPKIKPPQAPQGNEGNGNKPDKNR